MLLKRVRLENVLSYGPSGLDLELEPLNVLIGPNGSGKSNLIEVIGLLHAAPDSLHQTILDGGGVSNWLWRGEPRETFAQIEAFIPYTATIQLSYKLCFREANQRFQIHSEIICDDGVPNSHPYVDSNGGIADLLPEGSRDSQVLSKIKRMPVDQDKSVLSQVKAPDYPELTTIAKQLQQIRLYRQWEFGRQAQLRKPQPADLRNDELTEDCCNLGLVLNRLRRDHPSASDQILRELRRLYDGIDSIDVSIEGNTVQLFLREGNMTVPATRLSDGTLRYICLIAVLCQPKPPTLICIEEPEVGLHPDLLPGLADLMLEASERSQLLVTTHSDILVDRLTEYPEAVIVCEKLDGESQLRRLDASELKHWLQKYSLGELWTSGEIGGNRW